MIPREILKKIRQIEIRTNRLMTELLVDFLFQPPAQFSGVSRAVPNGRNYHLRFCRIDGEIDRVRPGRRDFHFSSQLRCQAKSFGVFADLFESMINFAGEFLTKPRHAFIVKINRFDQFPFRLLFNDGPKSHRLARYFLSISAMTSSSGRQRSGCLSASWARRSSSAICSGDKSGSIQPSSSPYSSQTFSMNARFSSVGIGRICSIRSVALMPIKLTTWNHFASA
jgi:hypothetical protein